MMHPCELRESHAPWALHTAYMVREIIICATLMFDVAMNVKNDKKCFLNKIQYRHKKWEQGTKSTYALGESHTS